MNGQRTINKISSRLLKDLFDFKAYSFENIEQSGGFSSQHCILSLRDELMGFLREGKNSNALFYIFLKDTDEDNFMMVVNNTLLFDDRTRRFAIVIKENWSGFEVFQLSSSSSFLILVKSFEICSETQG